MKSIALFLSFLVCTPVYSIDLVSFEGERTSVHSLHQTGKWTLVMLWSLDCIACEQQKPMIDAFNREHQDSNARVITAATDGDTQKADVKNFLHYQSYSFDNYLVISALFETQFKQEMDSPFRGTPTYLLYSPDGTLAGKHAGLLSRKQLEDIVGPAVPAFKPTVDLMR